MISFESDYIAGMHPEILKKMSETNLEPMSGYGYDTYTESAIAKIKDACGCPDAEVFLAVGGTQTNQLVISTMLKPYEGVVAATTGHVSVHEAGAIEYSGHKVLTIPSHDGKIEASELADYLDTFYGDANHEHMVFPGMVYISHPTEYGSLYSKDELSQIYDICKGYNIPLYIDGARLVYGICSKSSDVSLKDLATLCDVFYIGGTKAGAICGEAIVFTGKKMPDHFVTMVKQHGGLLAKGRLLGIQFDTLFTNDLYLQCGQWAETQKERLVSILKNAGIRFFYESPTNQQFVILEDALLEKLKEKVAVSFWEKYDETHTVVRFATSWSTKESDLDLLEEILKELH